VDDARALMALRDPVAGGDSATHVLVEHPELARFLTLAFESVWMQGSPALVEDRAASAEL